MFVKHPKNPTLPRTPDTFYSFYSANPDVLEFNGKIFYYFRGQGSDHHDQLGLAITDLDSFDGVNWQTIYPEPVLPVNTDRDAPDSLHVLDPACTVFQGRIYVYYTAHSCAGKSSICMSSSADGIHFERALHNPVMPDAVAPEVVVKDGKVMLFYQRWVNDGNKRSRIYVCTSEDGIYFDPKDEVPVFDPPEDYVSVVTNRIFEEDGVYYVFFGKCRRYSDYPEAFGIARSCDLLHWEYSSQDVLQRGEPGSWDEGAVWFPTVYKKDGRYYLWYEGGGTDNGRRTPEDIVASDLAIEGEYGGYGVTTFSQIGLACYDGSLKDFFQ